MPTQPPRVDDGQQAEDWHDGQLGPTTNRDPRLLTLDKLLLTTEEAASVLGISRTKVFELIREDKLESVQIDRCRRIPWAALEDFVTRLRHRHGPREHPTSPHQAPNAEHNHWAINCLNQREPTLAKGTTGPNTLNVALRHGPGDPPPD